MLLLALTSLAQAGWTQPDGGHYAKLGGRVIFGRAAFHSELTPAPEAIDIDMIFDYQLQFYTEYGLTGSWTAVAQGNPVGAATFRGDSMVYTGPLRLGVRRGLLAGKHNLAVQADGSYTPGVGDEDLTGGEYDGLVFIPGVQTARAHGQLSYGVGFDKGKWLKTAVTGEWSSAADLHPAATVDFQIGRVFNDTHRLLLDVSTRMTLGPPDEVSNFSGAGNRELVAFSIGYAWRFGDGWGVGTSFDSGFAVGSALGGGVLPVYAEHSGG